jgi:hypothetical protein
VDDLNHNLGDPNERLLSAALTYRNTGACPVVASGLLQKPSPFKAPDVDGEYLGTDAFGGAIIDRANVE